jgi:hypothetical protein
VRHYAAPDGRGGRFTKSPKHQLDLLAEALPADLGRVNNGYLQASRIRDLGTAAAAVELNFNQIRIGVHDDAQVVLGCSRDGAVEGKTRMAQVFTSTLATGWHVDAVDREGSVGSDSSIALDKSGNPHISYFDATQVDLGMPTAMPHAGTSKKLTHQATSAITPPSPSTRAATPVLAIMIRRTQRLSTSRDA